jgi:hypothetical protein
MEINDKKIQEIESGNHSMMRATNHAGIAKLYSLLHSINVKRGTQLEKIIYDNVFLEKYYKKDISDINFNKTQVINKLRFHQKKLDKELDFCFINENDIYLLELKDGEQFDSEQPSTWINRLLEFSKIIKTLTNKNVITKLVLFNCINVTSSTVAISKEEKEQYLMSGIDFCNLLNIDYNNINVNRNSQIEIRREILCYMTDIIFDSALECTNVDFDDYFSKKLLWYLEKGIKNNNKNNDLLVKITQDKKLS